MAEDNKKPRHELTDEALEFIRGQKVFFVATAPDGLKDSYPNLSPKNTEDLRVIDGKTLAYVDYHGSGNSTAAHLNENGRITLMFMSVGEKAMIMRVYGRGEAIRLESLEGKELIGKAGFRLPKYARQLILIRVDSFKKTCGLFVPYYKYMGERGAGVKTVINKTPFADRIIRLLNKKKDDA